MVKNMSKVYWIIKGWSAMCHILFLCRKLGTVWRTVNGSFTLGNVDTQRSTIHLAPCMDNKSVFMSSTMAVYLHVWWRELCEDIHYNCVLIEPPVHSCSVRGKAQADYHSQYTGSEHGWGLVWDVRLSLFFNGFYCCYGTSLHQENEHI